MGTRGRGKGSVDVESLERENDRDIDMLSERVNLLKGITGGIKKEADSHHEILDKMDDGMMGSRGLLTSINDKLRVAMSNKQNNQMMILVLAAVSIVVVFWWLTKR